MGTERDGRVVESGPYGARWPYGGAPAADQAANPPFEPTADFVHPESERRAAMRRHPSGRRLAGRFTQSHPWLDAPAPEEATPSSARARVEKFAVRALERAELVEAQLAAMEQRLAVVERRLSGEVEVRTFDGHVRTFDMPDASPTADRCSWVPAEPAE
ncbi:hypothetical protein [Nonomuraea recticatena]|uniref:hypothetical protein n=1 Tax=Nonomuraea recticatena TaxID=46178 RepID=UPI0031F8074B